MSMLWLLMLWTRWLVFRPSVTVVVGTRSLTNGPLFVLCEVVTCVLSIGLLGEVKGSPLTVISDSVLLCMLMFL